MTTYTLPNYESMTPQDKDKHYRVFKIKYEIILTACPEYSNYLLSLTEHTLEDIHIRYFALMDKFKEDCHLLEIKRNNLILLRENIKDDILRLGQRQFVDIYMQTLYP